MRHCSVLSIVLLIACGPSDDANTTADAGLGPIDASDVLADASDPPKDDGDSTSDAGVEADANVPPPPITSATLVVNEVDYDDTGAEQNEFVEVYNGTATAQSLDGLSLLFVNGNNDGDREYRRISLGDATLAMGEYLVVGSPLIVANLPEGTKHITFTRESGENQGQEQPTANIQNGTPGGDAVAIVRITTGTPEAVEMIDALSYGGEVTTLDGDVALSFVEGSVLEAVDDNDVTASLSRIENGIDTDDASFDWALTSSPTPGAANVLTVPAPVNLGAE